MTLKQKFKEIDEAEKIREDLNSSGRSQTHNFSPYTHPPLTTNFVGTYAPNYQKTINEKLDALAEYLDEKEKKDE